MKIIKICTILTITLFLSLALAPSVNASIGDDSDCDIAFEDENGDLFHVEFFYTKEQVAKFKKAWLDWEDLIKEVRADQQTTHSELKEIEAEVISLIEEVKELTYNPQTGEYYFPDIDIASFVHDSLFLMGYGSRIFSLGRGRVWIPLNRQGETFVGMRSLPMFVRHSIGFTRARSFSLFPLSRFILDRLFSHRYFTFGFTGLYINFGKRFFDSSVGPVIMIGRPSFLRVTDDFI